MKFPADLVTFPEETVMENFIFCVVGHSRVKDILWMTPVQICCSGDTVKNLVESV